MRLDHHQKLYGVLVLFCSFLFSSINANANSIRISSQQTETASAYILDIRIEGLDANLVNIETLGQKLVMTAIQGRIGSNTIEESQFIRYTFSFGSDANLIKLSRLNKKHKIKITIPKK